jgi:hypothetical protein
MTVRCKPFTCDGRLLEVVVRSDRGGVVGSGSAARPADLFMGVGDEEAYGADSNFQLEGRQENGRKGEKTRKI